MNNKITICLPTFNSASTINETLRSLESQTYRDFSLVVFDNASTDNTLEVVNTYRDKFKDLRIESSVENLGAEANFTRCIQYTGEGFMAIYHADDIYHPEIIQHQVKELELRNCVAVATAANRIDFKGRQLGRRFLPPELDGTEAVELSFSDFKNLIFKYGNFVVCPSVMAKADVMKNEIKVWNGKGFRTSADLDVWLRLSKIGSFAILTKPLISYREAQASTSFRMKKVRTYRHDFFLVMDQFIESADDDIKEFYDFLENKDLALRIYNGLTDLEEVNNFKPWKHSFMKLSVKGAFHRDFYLKMLLIWVFSRLKRLFT